MSTSARVRLSSSSVSSPTSRREVESSGLKYSTASPASPPLPRYWAAKPRTTSWSDAARALVERVEDLVEVDDRCGRGGAERGAVVELGRVAGREAERARSGWRCPTATSGGSSRGCPRAAARRAPGRGCRRRPGCRRVSSMLVTEPIRSPATCTSLSTTSWPAFSNSSVYSRPPSPRSSSQAASATNSVRATTAAPRAIVTPSPAGPGTRRPGTGGRTGCRSRTARRRGPTPRSGPSTARRCTPPRAWRT